MGALGGLDAARNVNRFYTEPRAHVERLPPIVESSAADWNEPPSIPTSIPGSGAVWIGGSSERHGDGSDVMEIDRAVERASVRVHRAHRGTLPRPKPAVDVAEPAPDEMADNGTTA